MFRNNKIFFHLANDPQSLPFYGSWFINTYQPLVSHLQNTSMTRLMLCIVRICQVSWSYSQNTMVPQGIWFYIQFYPKQKKIFGTYNFFCIIDLRANPQVILVIFFLIIKNLFIYLAVLGLCSVGAFLCLCWVGATLNCGEWVSYCGGFSCCGA